MRSIYDCYIFYFQMTSSDITVITEGLVNVQISSNCNSFTSEKRFAKDLTVGDLKSKLELITGASCLSMKITAFDKNDKEICHLDKDENLFGKTY